MSEQALKVSFGTTKRRFTVPRSITYDDFRQRLATLFPITLDDLIITYTDPDGDIISVSTEEELREMFRVSTMSTLLITVNSKSQPDYATARERAQAQAEDAGARAREQATRAAENAQASVESVLSGLGAFLSAFGQPGGPMGRRRRHHHHHQDFAAFAPFMASFAPLAAAFHQGSQGTCGISENTCGAFRQLREAITVAENRDEILRTAREVFPAARQWAIDHVSQEMNDDNIGQLCDTVSQTVQPVAGDRITGLLTGMIRAGLNDPAVVRMLRQIPWQATSDFEATMRGPGGRRGGMYGGRFDVHRNVSCDTCGKAPIVGSRYKATNRPNYDICSVCYNNENVSKEGLEFKEFKNVWEAVYPDATVPPSPIGFGDRGPAVAFLQKILTDLGYMNASMYRWRVGFYGPNTRGAVEQFQREYGLETVAEIGQYDATTAASLTSVIEAQVPPTAATGGASAGDAAAGSADQGQPKADAPEPEPSPAQG